MGFQLNKSDTQPFYKLIMIDILVNDENYPGILKVYFALITDPNPPKSLTPGVIFCNHVFPSWMREFLPSIMTLSHRVTHENFLGHECLEFFHCFMDADRQFWWSFATIVLTLNFSDNTIRLQICADPQYSTKDLRNPLHREELLKRFEQSIRACECVLCKKNQEENSHKAPPT